MREKVICSVGAFCVFMLVLLLGWYAGVDYMNRGADPAFWTTEALLGALWAFLALRYKFTPAAPTLGPPLARISMTVATFLVVLFEGWYRGVELTVRGQAQAYIVLCALAFAVVCWTCPIWKPSFGERKQV